MRKRGLIRNSSRLWRLILAGAAMAFMLGACEGKGGETESSSVQESTQASQETQESSAGVSGGENAAVKESKTSQELYEGFLKGEIPVYGDKLNEKFYNYTDDAEVSYFPNENGYTLKQLTRRLQELSALNDENAFIEEVSYCYVDCGLDGEQELVLSIYSNGDLWGEGGTKEFVIKNFDGKLQICKLMYSSYHEENYLANAKGLISDSYYAGYGGYSAYGFLNADCEYKFWYSCEETYEMGAIYGAESGLEGAAYRIAAEEEDDYAFEGVYLYAYRFQEGDDAPYYYTYDYYYEESETIPEDKKALVDRAFADANEKCYSFEEIEEMQAQKIKELGYTDDSVTEWDYELGWQTLDQTVYWPGEIVTVDTAAKLMEAVKDNAIIYLEPGTYDLTKWLQSGNNFEKIPFFESGDYRSENPEGVLYSGYDDSSWEITIYGIKNMTIASANPSDPARIVCDCPYSKVLQLDTCSHVTLKDLILGHEVEPGHCSGDVVGISNSNSVAVEGCDLYGCGAYALGMEDSFDLEVRDCVIHDCTYGCMEMYSAGWVGVYNTTFENCKEYTMFEVYEGTVYFDNCTFRNLDGHMIALSDNGYATFCDCQFDMPALDSLKSNPDFESKIWVY